MAYNNGFPVTYPQYYPQYQTFQPIQPQSVQQTQQSGMTPPTVHADIYQVSSEQEAAIFPVAAGSSQMMITKDEKEIIVKTAYPNGQSTIDVYEKRPPAPVQKPVDMSAYVTREELDERLAALAPRKPKKDTEEIKA